MAHGFQYGILSPVVGLFVNEIWEPVKKQFGYCFKPGSKVRHLARAADGLKVSADTIDEQIQLGKRPRDSTISWIQSARSIADESSTIKNEYEQRSICMFGCSWNCFFNYRIGRTATKKKKKVDELKEEAPQNDSMFTLLPPIGRELPLPRNIVGQNNYLEEIVKCIRQGTTSFIGICSMGGAGKTTLLRQLNNTFSRAAELHEFDHVIYVEIGQQPNLGTVQQNIASQLGLTLGQDESATARSASLYNFLKERKFLLLMDNLWQPLDLVKVGIAQGHGKIGPQNRQMIVITTRDEQICHRMQPLNHLILLQRLNSEQAWGLFAENVGRERLTNSSAEIICYAENIVEKCGGLPLAIKIVGQAMASKQSEHEWKLAVQLLQHSQYHKVPDADAESDLYHVLYISYNHLPDDRTKQCFLFLALSLNVGYYIPYAIEFWMGHGLLDEDDDISNNYLRGHSIVGCLKRACLLEEHPRGPNYLRMHDTIRGLVLWIVKSRQGDGPNNNWLIRAREQTAKAEECSTAHRISIWDSSDMVVLGGPRRLLLTLSFKGWSLSHVPPGFFRTAPSLTYLELSLTNIRQLPSDVGELVNLQYLGLSQTPIQSIPTELQLLKSLRYLDLSETFALETIPDGTISALIMLRSLDLYRSWPFPADKTKAQIEELKSLTSLQSLGFTVSDSDSLQMILGASKPSLKSLCIKNMDELPVLHITPASFSKTRAHQLEMWALSDMLSLKELSIGETVVDSDWHFKILDELILVKIIKLENIIWKGVVPHACLPRLRRLIMDGCHGIRAITWIKQLPCLEEAYLMDCNSMVELVADDAEGLTMSSDGDSFPRLKLLGLSCLPNLQNICDNTLAFPCLQRLLLYSCPKLAKLPSGLLQPQHAPLILSQPNFWDQLCWEDSTVKSTMLSFSRDLPESFKGDILDVYRALAL
ncbi:unnamed protein product [Alopecurus aequalis]